QGRRPRRIESGWRERQGNRVRGEAEGGVEAGDAELVLRRRRQGAVRGVLRVCAAEVTRRCDIRCRKMDRPGRLCAALCLHLARQEKLETAPSKASRPEGTSPDQVSQWPTGRAPSVVR